MTRKKYVSLTEATELDDMRLAAANAISFWRDIKWRDIKPADREAWGIEMGWVLDAINNYQASLCTLLGITVQQEPKVTLLTGVLIIKEPLLGTMWEDIPRTTLHYYQPDNYVPYKLWVGQGGTILGVEAYSTQDLIARIHDAHCVMQVFGEERPFIN